MGVPERSLARDIVRRWGWNGTSYQILNPGFSFWLDAERDAVIGYVTHHKVRVVGGAPVCPEENFDDVLRAFERDAQACGEGVFYFGAEWRLASFASADPRRITFPIGAQPVWAPDVLLGEFRKHSSLRAQLNRARNKGVTTRVLRVHADASVGGMRACLQEWIERRGLPALHFLIETETLDDLLDRRVLVAERDGHIIGFLVATPIPARNGWLIEQNVRGAHAPNGTAELLFHDTTAVLAEQNASMVTLGLAPLAHRGEPLVDRAPQWLHHLLDALRAHGKHFYNFEGLEAFKSKFGGSQWDPVYASAAPATSLSRALLAVTAAFSGESLLRFAPHVIARGLLREAKRLVS